MSNWKAIETAPRDGSAILGYRDDCGVLLIRWISPIDFMTDSEIESAAKECGPDTGWLEQEDWFCADFCYGSRLEGGEAPTHWIPLPPDPPKYRPPSPELIAAIAADDSR